MSTTQLADPRTVRSAVAGKKLNKQEAQALTAQIRQAAGSLWQLVAEAHDRKAWKALGYMSWKDYAVEELQMSESRSYQWIDTGRVMRAIGEAAGSDAMGVTVVTVRDVAKIKPYLSVFERELRQALKDEFPIEEAVQEAIYALPTREKQTREPREARGPRVIDHEPVDAELLAQLSGPERTAAARAVPLPTFSTAEAPIERIVPKGRKLCSACQGHGYL